MSARRVLAPKYWGFHLVGLLCVGIALALGLWQLEAWQAQREHESRDLTLIAPTQLNDALGPDEAFPGSALGQPVLIEGTWVPEGTVHVRDRERNGKVGLWVVTPLAIEQSGGPDSSGHSNDPAILVVRGWTPTVADSPPPPSGEAEFVGLLQPTEGKAGLTDDDPQDDVLPQLRLADAIQHVDQDLYGGYVVVAEEVAAEGEWPVGVNAVNAGTSGLAHVGVDQLPEPSRSTGLRNLLYAIEWWVFGLFAGFIWWRWARDEIERVDSNA